MAVRYNKSIFLKQVTKLVNSRPVKKMMQDRARKEFDARKTKFIREFRDHKVTQEILSGPGSDNPSGTLTGRGNLFTFIGFPEASDPINSLYYALERGITMNKTPQVTKQKKGAIYRFKVFIPNNQDFINVAPMPWERGRSWVTGVEKGISGLSYYIYKQVDAARSGRGVQTSSPYIAGLTFRRVPYLSQLLGKFKGGSK